MDIRKESIVTIQEIMTDIKGEIEREGEEIIIHKPGNGACVSKNLNKVC